MSTKVTEGIQSSSLAFLNLRKRQHVSKSKLKEDFVQNAWNTCSAGFGKNNLMFNEEPERKFNLKSNNAGGCIFSTERNTETLHHRLLGTDYKAVKRKSMLEIGNIGTDFSSPTAQNTVPVTQTLNSAQFLQSLKKEEKGHKEKQKFDNLCVTKKQKNPVLNSIENPFKKNIAHIAASPLTKACPVRERNFDFGIPVEQENVFRKRKFPNGSFIDPSLNFPLPCASKDVIKKSIVPSIVHHAVNSDSFSEVALKKKVKIYADSTREYQSEDEVHSGSLVLFDKDRSFLDSLNASKAYLNNSTDSKGSNWVQSLQWSPLEHGDLEHKDRLKKKKLRNLVQGGYAEQLLKLQRREQSEKIIWEHKLDKNKEKAVKNTLSMLITAISSTGRFINVKARCLDFAAQSETVGVNVHDTHIADCTLLSSAPMLNDSSTLPGSEIFLVLFKKTHFNQLNLKIKDVFRLHPPWQMLKSSLYNIILCTYFVECIPRSSENQLFEEGISNNPDLLMVKHNTVPPTLNSGLTSSNAAKDSQCLTSLKELIFRWGESMSLYGRVQRIWYHEVCLPGNFLRDIKHYRFSLLLQEQMGTLYEVIFTANSSLSRPWLQFVLSAEGKCFGFSNLHLSHRFLVKRHKPLMKFLELFSYQLNVGQEFMYQMMFDINSKVPEEINSESYPPYCQAQVDTMCKLIMGMADQRFACIGKVLFEHENVFYISDESLLHEPMTKFFQLQLLFPFETKSLTMGSVVFIKEALITDGHLVLDKYSHFTVLSGSQCLPTNLSISDEKKLKQLTLMAIQDLIMPLDTHCKAGDIVYIEGQIIDVDESSAFSFLLCCFCLQENLVQDTNLVIYCEDCSQVVSKPLLKIKMEVSLCVPRLDSVEINVQLTSSTIKKTLKISDDAQQPHCQVVDVLGKSIGPILCQVRSCNSIDKVQTFYLSEIQSK